MTNHKIFKLKKIFYLITLSCILTIIYSTPILGKSKVNNSNDEIVRDFDNNKLGKILINYPYFMDRSVSFKDDFVSGQSFLIYNVKVDMYEIRKSFSRIHPQLNSVEYINLHFYIPTTNLMKVNNLHYEITQNNIKHTDTIPSNRFDKILEIINQMYPDFQYPVAQWKNIDNSYLPTILNHLESQSIKGILSIINHNQRILNIISDMKKVYNK